MSKCNVVAIIPARGGSLGIPKKNLLPLCNKPLIGWTIEHALESSKIDRVFVSTDDAEIEKYSESRGVDVIKRPEVISGPNDSSESAILHTLDNLKDNLGINPELVVFLQATSPLRMPNDIDKSIELFSRTKADSLFSSSIAADLTIWNKENEVWNSSNFDYKKRVTRQAAPVQYVENGSIYLFRPELLVQMGNRLGGKIESYIMEPWQVHEIDVMEDVDLVKYYMEKYLIG